MRSDYFPIGLVVRKLWEVWVTRHAFPCLSPVCPFSQGSSQKTVRFANAVRLPFCNSPQSERGRYEAATRLLRASAENTSCFGDRPTVNGEAARATDWRSGIGLFIQWDRWQMISSAIAGSRILKAPSIAFKNSHSASVWTKRGWQILRSLLGLI